MGFEADVHLWDELASTFSRAFERGHERVLLGRRGDQIFGDGLLADDTAVMAVDELDVVAVGLDGVEAQLRGVHRAVRVELEAARLDRADEPVLHHLVERDRPVEHLALAVEARLARHDADLDGLVQVW